MSEQTLTVIIPVHKVTGQFKDYFENAIKSIVNNEINPAEVLVVYPNSSEIKKTLESFNYEGLAVRLVPHKESKDFQTQLNVGAKEVKTTYFTFLEFDDEYSSIWFKNAMRYAEKQPDIDMFLPIISDVNQDNEFIGYSNEVAWALNFSNELGFFDHDTLSEYPNVNIDGMVVKTEAYLNCGGLKPSIKLSFNYEFLLRFTNLTNKIMVIPKIGYKHTNMREDSLFWNYRNDPKEELTPEEAKFWMDTAKEEFYHKADRGITYTKEV